MKGGIVYPPVVATMYLGEHRFVLADGSEEWEFWVEDLDGNVITSFPLGYRPLRDYELISKAFWDCVVRFLREDKNPNIRGL